METAEESHLLSLNLSKCIVEEDVRKKSQWTAWIS